MDLERSKEQLKHIRSGMWSMDDLYKYFTEKESLLEKLYVESKLQHSPDEDKIKGLLIECLEEHFGSISTCIEVLPKEIQALKDIENILLNYRSKK